MHVTKFSTSYPKFHAIFGSTYFHSFVLSRTEVVNKMRDRKKKVPTTIFHTAIVYSCKHLKYKTLRSNMSNIWATRILINRSLDTALYFPFTVQWLQRKREKENPFLSMLGYSRRTQCAREDSCKVSVKQKINHFFLSSWS